MTARKLLLRIYLWFFVAAFIIFIVREMVSNGWAMERMADIRKESIINLSRMFALMFLIFGAVYLFFKVSRKRMKRALSNFHFFASCVSYILLTITYAKMEGIGAVPKTIFSKEVADSPIMEAQTLINMVYALFVIAQVMFLINIYIAIAQKNAKSSRSEGKPVRRPLEKSRTAS